MSTPSDRQATLGPEPVAAAAPRCDMWQPGGPEDQFRTSEASPACRVQTEVCDRHVEGATEPSGDSGDRTSRRGHTEVRRW